MPHESMGARRSLQVATGVLVTVALLGLGVSLLLSLGVSVRSENEHWGAFDLSDLEPGSVRAFARSWVYRRTEADKLAIDVYVGFLDDPDSQKSRQPLDARNKWRSSNPDYFIFHPYAPIRLCGVELVHGTDPRHSSQYFGGAPVVAGVPFFFEPCGGRRFDQSGRVLARPGAPAERNLIVPEVKWRGNQGALVLGK